ncbi:hypothetical protein B296_00012670 [Ensete ventricosum]|uniref:Uncharacterized protein n=1 Tax=Ensete ventricosum TaxID=4639 RepID=A0A426ZPY5_ENSVE|nr:hypothetical protein B296_00012670 [Ensete ventricosum]
MQWDLTGSSLGDSPKRSGNSLGACREITRRRPDDLPQECRRLPDWMLAFLQNFREKEKRIIEDTRSTSNLQSAIGSALE